MRVVVRRRIGSTSLLRRCQACVSEQRTSEIEQIDSRGIYIESGAARV
jgi:hypothetical protein